MGIEIPPPKGGPAVFTNPSPGSQSPAAASPDEDHLRTPELPDDLTDGGSVCMSEGGACWSIMNSCVYIYIFYLFIFWTNSLHLALCSQTQTGLSTHTTETETMKVTYPLLLHWPIMWYFIGHLTLQWKVAVCTLPKNVGWESNRIFCWIGRNTKLYMRLKDQSFSASADIRSPQTVPRFITSQSQTSVSFIETACDQSAQAEKRIHESFHNVFKAEKAHLQKTRAELTYCVSFKQT